MVTAKKFRFVPLAFCISAIVLVSVYQPANWGLVVFAIVVAYVLVGSVGYFVAKRARKQK
jgi:hypothetical protein